MKRSIKIYLIVAIGIFCFNLSLFAEETIHPPIIYPYNPTAFVEVHGYGQLHYIDTPQIFPSFELNEFELTFLGNLTKEIRVETEVEIEEGKDLELETGTFAWDLNNKHTLRFGKFYTPFGLEIIYHRPHQNELVMRPETGKLIIPGSWRSVGLFYRGLFNIKKIGFNLQASLNNGLSAPDRSGRQTSENNTNKEISFRLGMVPIHNFEIGVSSAYGKYDPSNLFAYTLAGIDAAIKLQNLMIRTEYAHMNSENEFGKFSKNGFYIQGAYTFLKERKLIYSLLIATRFEVIDTNSKISDINDEQIITIGLKWDPVKLFFIKIDYEWRNETKIEEISNNAFHLGIGAAY